MKIDAPLTFHQDHERVDWQALEELFVKTNLNGRQGPKLRRAFEKSQLVCYVCSNENLIAVGRAITDGEYHAVIYDVVVDPQYQGNGIGKSVIEYLLKRLPVWRVMLIAAADVQPFYIRSGFEGYPDAMARLDWSKLQD